MHIKEIRDEDFTSYKKPSMVIGFPSCNWKCEKECGEHCCQNSALAQAPLIDIPIDTLIQRYINNPITKSIVCGGLEPFDSWVELLNFIKEFRYHSQDDVVIYTGYKEEEIIDKISVLKSYESIIIKFGRYIPRQQPHYDEVLGVNLASDNQYAKIITIQN